jgi:hypothetical protein
VCAVTSFTASPPNPETRRESQELAGPLKGRRESPGRGGLRAQTAVTQGDPDGHRPRGGTRVDMTAIGAHGLGRLKRFLVGSTSLAVARYAPCPVDRPGSTAAGRTHSGSVDGSGDSRAALRFPIALGRKQRADATLGSPMRPRYSRMTNRTIGVRGLSGAGDRAERAQP